MSIQDPTALALQTLSILSDTPPYSDQPHLEDGIYLRWFIGKNRAFPLKGGYYLFRRRVAGANCLMPLLQSQTTAAVARLTSLPTTIGTLSAVPLGDAAGQDLKPLPPGASTPGIQGFTIDQQGLRFSLPVKTPAMTASQFTVRLQFPVPAPGAASTQVTITASAGSKTVFTQTISAPAPPTSPEVIVTANPTTAVDTIQIVSTGGSVTLLDLCYVPASVVTTSGAPAAVTNLVSRTLAAAAVSGPALPGNGWELIPNLNSAITLPLIHPSYPASPGPESINTSLAIAQSRMHYGVWTDSFGSSASIPGTGTITLTNGSPLVTGSLTGWTAGLVGSLIAMPAVGPDYTAYAVMAVLTPTCLALSRPWSGPTQTNVAYALLQGDDFAELHDRIASLLNNPSNMRAATAPPVLDQGTIANGKSVQITGNAASVQGIGTQWSSNLIGCCIEIGPTWSFGSYVAGSNTYRIQNVVSPTQITLDRPFAGPASGLPTTGCYQIVARASGDILDPNGPNGPAFEFKPMDLLELASLVPSYAQALGLHWIDTSVVAGDTFDYIVIADHDDKFSHQAANALTWLNGNPVFSGDALDGYVVTGVKHAGSSPLAAPTQTVLFALPCAGARASIANPNRADSDPGISVQDAASWYAPSTPQPAPVMMDLRRLSQGVGPANLVSVDTLASYQDLGRMIPTVSGPDPNNVLPDGWPAQPIHFIDSGEGTGLDVGWYAYRTNNIDIFGRWSALSDPIPWVAVDGRSRRVESIQLQDLIAPPPPAGVLAWVLDDRDPYMFRDEAFKTWRKNLPGAAQWANWTPGDPYPTDLTRTGPAPIPPVVGLRVQWRWPWAHQNQGPDLEEFRIYLQSTPLNVRMGKIASVAAGQPTTGQSQVTLVLGAADTTAANAYIGATLQTGNRSYPIQASQSTAVQLTVQNGGALQNEPPASNVDGVIVIPVGHPLAKDLLDPKNWEQWLAAVPQNLAGTQYDVQMVEDPTIVTVDAATANTFTGAAATWNGTAFVLDAIPSPHTAASIRPGIDVLALTSAMASFVVQIQSVSGLQIVPVSLPSGAPVQAGQSSATQFQWQMGPAATWSGAAFTLSGIPAVVRPGIDVLALASATTSFVVQIQRVSGSQIVPVATSLPTPAPVAGTTYQWQLGPVTTGLQGIAGTWDAVNHILTLDGNPDLSGVHVGTDLVYIATTGTPDNLSSFYAVDAIDNSTAAKKTVTLNGTTAQLSALTTGPLPWKIGQPVRHYEVFLPDPSVNVVPMGLAPGRDLSGLLVPTLTQPVVHGTVGISSADWRTEVTDQVQPTRGRTGNEGFLSAPAPVFRVLRDPPPVPTYSWKAPLLATKANYKAESYFTVRWNNPGTGYFAHIFRAMDNSIFLAIWQFWMANPPAALPTAGAPAPISAFLTSFNTHQTQYTAHLNAAAAAAASSTLAQSEAALAQAEYQAAVALFAPLDDASLFWLAGLPELADAYKQITINALDLSDPANADRLGPDDALPFTPAPNVCAYVDTLPGRSTNKYFYRVMLIDGTQNRSQLGNVSPPVYVPKVVPPRTPVITSVLGGDRQITISWATNREPDLAEYRIYRADSGETAQDLRTMTLVATNVVSAADLSSPPTHVVWNDTGAIAGRPYFYRISAADSANNASVPSLAVSTVAVDTSIPAPVVWTDQKWVLLRDFDGVEEPWPTGGIIPAGSKAAVRLGWTSTAVAATFRVARQIQGRPAWQPIAVGQGYTEPTTGTFLMYDRDAEPQQAYTYRVAITSSSGVSGQGPTQVELAQPS